MPYYKGRQVRIPKESSDPRVNYLKSRLGYFPERKDFCFNGFAFKEHLMKNQYAKILIEGPEFMVRLAEYVEADNVVDDYRKNSIFYCIRYDVALDDVIFDGHEAFLNPQKQLYFLKACLLRMLGDMEAKEDDNDNVILRLREDCHMSEKNYIGKEIVENELALE